MALETPERRPLVSCSPFALVIVLLAAAAYFGWRLAAPLLERVHDPQATPRLVTARGDLAEDEKSTIELFRKASPSVVHISTWETRYATDRFRLRALDVPQGTGSGFVWDERGYIVTNFHVVGDASRAVVTLDDHSDWEAVLVGWEPNYDVAVLKIDAPHAKLPALPIGTSKDLQVGQKVFAIGNPFGLDHTLTTGVISGLEREILSVTQRPIRGVIQTDAAINPGNSGGPLLDSSGRLIGMNTAIVSPSGVSAGVGFAVPVDTINAVVPGLIRRGKYERPRIGVKAAPEPIARRIGVEGVAIEAVDPGSPAERAGLRALEKHADGSVDADVITELDGKHVTSADDIWEIMGDHHAGDSVRITFVRAGKPTKVDVKLQENE